jgi:hypothetical protein
VKYYKITVENERHREMVYKDGLNVDVEKFNPSGNCAGGGIYFSREDILAFLWCGVWLREVTLPEDAQVYENPGEPKKWKADKVVLGQRERITVGVIKRLIKEGVNVHADDDYALRWASENRHLEVVKLLVEHGANIHANKDYALRWASHNGHLEVVKLLVEYGANIHANKDYALRWASGHGHLEVVKLLLAHGAGVHVYDDYALRWASHNGHRDVVKLLLDWL